MRKKVVLTLVLIAGMTTTAYAKNYTAKLTGQTVTLNGKKG